MNYSQSIKVDGRNVVYDSTAPADRSVVFVHGGFGSTSDLWHLSMESLPNGYAGYAINNFLHSDAPSDGYNVSSFANRLAHFSEALSLKNPVIVGHSMGGVVCQIAAIRFPEVFGGVVLVGTGPSMRDHGVGQMLLDRLRTEGFSRSLMSEVSANWFYKDPPAGFFDAYVERAMKAPLDAMIDVQASLLETDLVEDLGKIKAPTLIVHGAHDVGRPLRHAHILKTGIPGSQLHVCEESGHSPMLEAPEEFNAVFHNFLQSIDKFSVASHSPTSPERI